MNSGYLIFQRYLQMLYFGIFFYPVALVTGCNPNDLDVWTDWCRLTRHRKLPIENSSCAGLWTITTVSMAFIGQKENDNNVIVIKKENDNNVIVIKKKKTITM